MFTLIGRTFDLLLLRAFVGLERFGAPWAWRLVRLLHTIPFLALAFGWGLFCGWAWGVTSPAVSGFLCAGLVLVGMTWTWFKEWRRGY